MADIFISYKKEDAGRVVRIVEGLRAEGFTVWWDHGIAPGNQWDQTIQHELSQARVVVAIWSEESINAPWVKEEAGVGKSRGALVPARIDNVNPPLGFGLIQFADLIDWDGDIEDAHWDFFIESIRAVMSGEAVSGLERPAARRRRRFWPVAALLALGVLGAGGLLAWNALSGVDAVSYERTGADGATTTTTLSRSAPPSAAETEMFEAAQSSALKSDYQDYLRSFPQGAYARRVREEILPLCEPEQRPIWVEQRTGQQVAASSAESAITGASDLFPSEEEACAVAHENFVKRVEDLCNTFGRTPNARNSQLNYTLDDCDCDSVQGGWFCNTLSTYNCTWETQSVEVVEVCG